MSGGVCEVSHPALLRHCHSLEGLDPNRFNRKPVMDATLTVLSSFVAGVVAHAIWQAHRGASDMQQQQRRRGQASDEGGEGRDAAALVRRRGTAAFQAGQLTLSRRPSSRP